MTSITLNPNQISQIDFTDYEIVLDNICEIQKNNIFLEIFPDKDYEEYKKDVTIFYDKLNKEEQEKFNNMEKNAIYYFDMDCERNKFTIKRYKVTFKNAIDIKTSVTMNDEDFNLVMVFHKPLNYV